MSNIIRLGGGGADLSVVTAGAADILAGKVIVDANGNPLTGTIASKSAQTYTPGTANQTIAAGQYLSGAQTIAGDADLTAANIKSGVNIFGVNGTFTSDADASASNITYGKTAYVNGAKVTGTNTQDMINLVGSVALTGSYASEFSLSNTFIANDPNGNILIVMKGASSTDYENIAFELVSAPSGCTLLTGASYFSNGNPSGNYYGCVIQGVSSKVSVGLGFNGRNTSNDYHRVDITLTSQ